MIFAYKRGNACKVMMVGSVVAHQTKAAPSLRATRAPRSRVRKLTWLLSIASACWKLTTYRHRFARGTHAPRAKRKIQKIVYVRRPSICVYYISLRLSMGCLRHGRINSCAGRLFCRECKTLLRGARQHETSPVSTELVINLQLRLQFKAGRLSVVCNRIQCNKN